MKRIQPKRFNKRQLRNKIPIEDIISEKRIRSEDVRWGMLSYAYYTFQIILYQILIY